MHLLLQDGKEGQMVGDFRAAEDNIQDSGDRAPGQTACNCHHENEAKELPVNNIYKIL